jgi:hypothetical protein
VFCPARAATGKKRAVWVLIKLSYLAVLNHL